jgi:hypothetical protein
MIPTALTAICLLLLVWWTVRGNFRAVQGIEDVRKQLKPVDLQCFENLVDPAQDLFLRRHLNAQAFRKVQRARRIAAVEYLWRLARNAGLLIRAGEYARTADNPELAAAARALAATAAMTRMLALLSILRLSAGIAFPQTTTQCDSFVRRYGLMTSSYMHLGSLWRSGQQGT